MFFSVDLDGCLRGNGRTPLPKGHYLAQAMIARYIAEADQGNALPLLGGCTGRDFASAEAAFLDLVLPKSWTLFEGGARAVNFATGEIRVNPRITQEKVAALAWVREEWLPQALQNPQWTLYTGGKDYVITLEWTPDTLPKVREAAFLTVKADLQHLKDSLSLSMSSIALDIGIVDKGDGIEWVAEMMGIKLSQIVGIGDSGGDSPLLQKVGHPAAVANATPECKDLAEFVATESHAAGVWEIICHYLKQAGIQIPFSESTIT